MLMKFRKIIKGIGWKGIFNFEKKTDSTTSASETSKNVFVFSVIFLFVSFGVYIYVQYSFKALRNQTENNYWSCLNEDQKFIKRICYML